MGPNGDVFVSIWKSVRKTMIPSASGGRMVIVGKIVRYFDLQTISSASGDPTVHKGSVDPSPRHRARAGSVGSMAEEKDLLEGQNGG